MSSVGTKCPDGGTKCRRRKCPWGTLEHRRWLEFGLGTNARPTEVPLGEIRLEPIRQGEGVSRASSQAAYPSFPPKGEKLAHSAAPPFPTEPACAGLRRGPRFGTRRFQRTKGPLACLSPYSFFTKRKSMPPEGVSPCEAANWFWSSRILHSLTNCSASIPPVSLRTPPPFTQGRLWYSATPLVLCEIAAFHEAAFSHKALPHEV